jgi:DNA polymerase-4
MDAFYASVELLRHPDLTGRPVVIGGRRRADAGGQPERPEFETLDGYAGRGVVTTATYEARALGVHSGMGLMRAAALAPQAILLPADFDEYRKYSRLFKAAVREVAPRIEDRGIDEIYVDLTDVSGDDVRVAHLLKARVREATGLSCSIGIAPNKLLAKICSDLDKPDGLTILGMDDIAGRIWPLDVRKVNGIGPKSATRLAALGIRTIGQLAAMDRDALVEAFGRSYGGWLHDAAWGRDDRPVVTHSEPKSVSRETTFERDLHPARDRAILADVFTQLCARVSEDLRRKGYAGRTVGIKLRYADFHTVTRDCTLDRPIADPVGIRRAAGGCLKRVALDRRLRLLGVRIGSLCPLEDLQRFEAGRAPQSPHGGTLALF